MTSETTLSTRTAVAARGLRKTYGTGDAPVRALNGVDVEFDQGRFTAIMGPSGSGKSTLMHCLAGLDTADAGRIVRRRQRDRQPGRQPLTRLRRDRIGFVFQAFNLVPTLTAEQNIVLPLDLAGGSRRPGLVRRVVDDPRPAGPAQAPARTSSPAASSSAWPWPGRC